MENSLEFLRKILDSVSEHIVAIDESGDIRLVNKSWSSFGSHSGCVTRADWKGVNYLDECDKAAAMGDELGREAGAGIRSVMANRLDEFYLEYPCHSLEAKRWFMMRVTPFESGGHRYYVISHQNITERKLAEQEMKKLSRLDGLTNIPNRRVFDEFLDEEWRRCLRIGKPISLALVDLDYFKALNDTYGHQAGDECLKRVGRVLDDFVKRPSDICARYGGEEFALVWGDTGLDKGKLLASRLLERIASLGIENRDSPIQGHMTASIGLASLIPCAQKDKTHLISMADTMLYRAKELGRNRIVGGDDYTV